MPSSPIDSVLRELTTTPPREPDGWFRWMHHGMQSRDWLWGSLTEVPVVIQEGACPHLAKLLAEEGKDRRELEEPVLAEVRRHAWEFGSIGARVLIERALPQLAPEERGRALAGLLESFAPRRVFLPKLRAWLDHWWTGERPVVFEAASAVQAVSCLMSFGWPDLAARILATSPEWGDEPVGRWEPGGLPSSERWSGIMDRLSHRAVDRCLEAAVRIGSAESARHCLEAGADPNLGIWQLERSCNNRYSALDFAIRHAPASGEGCPLAETLLAGGASAVGTEFGGFNHPLFSALSRKAWELADRLLDLGASFTNPGPKEPPPVRKEEKEHEGEKQTARRWTSPAGPGFGNDLRDLDWVRDRIGSLLPLCDRRDQVSFYQGDGQGGRHTTFLPLFMGGEKEIGMLERFEKRGLPFRPSAHEVLGAIQFHHYEFLTYLFDRFGVTREAMYRVRRFCPDFGTVRNRYLCRPEPNRSNWLERFDPGSLVPLEMPDGTRYHACLDSIAPPGHDHGALPPRHLFALTLTANFRRRADCLITRGLRQRWEIKPIPGTTREATIRPVQVRRLLNVVKEVDGVFFWTALTMDRLTWQDWPPGWEKPVKEWSDGKAGQAIIAEAERRIAAQDEFNRKMPDPVLDEEELDGYPREFWPFLRRLPDETIGIVRGGGGVAPSIAKRYREWAIHNKPDLESFLPDPRLMKWPLWDSIPWEFQPFFVYDETFRKPTVRHEGRNDFEKAMIRKAVAWNNQTFLEAFREMTEGSGREEDDQ